MTKEIQQTMKEESKRRKEEKSTTKTTNKARSKMAIGTYLSIITLNVNGLNTPIKRHRVTEWIEKTRPIYMMPTRDSFHI